MFELLFVRQECWADVVDRCVFAVVEMTPPAIAQIGWKVFIIFAVLNACWVPIV